MEQHGRRRRCEDKGMTYVCGEVRFVQICCDEGLSMRCTKVNNQVLNRASGEKTHEEGETIHSVYSTIRTNPPNEVQYHLRVHKAKQRKFDTVP